MSKRKAKRITIEEVMAEARKQGYEITREQAKEIAGGSKSKPIFLKKYMIKKNIK